MATPRVRWFAGRAPARPHLLHVTVTTVCAAAGAFVPPAHAACGAPAKPIEAENCRPGDPASEWDVSGAGSPAIQGFATEISVDQGDTVAFKVDTVASDYRIDVYRLGWYGGAGARRVATVQPPPPPAQPSCAQDSATGKVDCSNWHVSARWEVPADATSGLFLGRLVREDGTEGASHAVFVVRDDDGRSDLLFQTSDTTWQAYNDYGGTSLYKGGPGVNPARAYAVSYDRPFSTRATAPEDWLFNSEYPMVRWLERNGYDVSYSTGVDTDRRGGELREHRAFLSVGHDEYWSGDQRANVEAARDAGVHLAFFSGNEVFWKTRWTEGHRTLVSYKETAAGEKLDPAPTWTGTWRDPRPFNPEGGRPENALTGTLFAVNAGTAAIEVPAADGWLRFWRSTEVAGQADGTTATLSDGTLGYEWDEDVDNGFRPAGLMRLSSTTVRDIDKLLDHGSTYGTGDATHALTLHRDANGAGPDALVFGAGTIQWSWGLDATHDRGDAPVSPAMRQATANLFADMHVQPQTPEPGLAPATASTDDVAPSAWVELPARGLAVVAGEPATVHGTAADAGGGRVGAVEVSVDDGATWHPAVGREQWSYTWTPAADGVARPQVRAADDSGNLGPPPDALPTPPGGPAGPGEAAGHNPGARAARRARVRIRPARVRMSRRGGVVLRVTCPRQEAGCRVRLRLRRRAATLAARRLTVPEGTSRTARLRLTRPARRTVRRRGSLRVTAAARVRSPGLTTSTLHRPIHLLAPRSR